MQGEALAGGPAGRPPVAVDGTCRGLPPLTPRRALFGSFYRGPRVDSPEQWLADAGIDPATLRPLADLGRGRTVFLVSVPVKDAMDAWERLRRFTARSGFFPVILGQDDFGDEPEYDGQTPAGADADLAQAALLDVDQWLAERRADQEAEAEELEISLPTRDFPGDWDAKAAAKRPGPQFLFPKHLAKQSKTAAPRFGPQPQRLRRAGDARLRRLQRLPRPRRAVRRPAALAGALRRTARLPPRRHARTEDHPPPRGPRRGDGTSPGSNTSTAPTW